MAKPSSSKLIRPLVQKLHPYVPGEQPKIKGLIKLNTNENPYPPAPGVLRAIKAAVDGRLRLYPNPTAQRVREKLARLHDCAPENIIVGNGSDELLALAVRAFVEPAGGRRVGIRVSRATVQYFTPSYSLYPVLAEAHGALINPVPLQEDFSLPSLQQLRRERIWDNNAALTFVTTPNAPSGKSYLPSELEALCARQQGVVILDEAYVDFARENALKLGLKHPNVLISRTFSKAYSLCFQRIGYFVGPLELIQALDKIRDSYNVNGLGQIAAEATLENLSYYRRNFQRIIDTRTQLTADLLALGFQVLPSETNFILAKPRRFSAEEWLEKLRDKKLLVRWFKYPEVRDYLRITIGTEAEMKKLLLAVKSLLK